MNKISAFLSIGILALTCSLHASVLYNETFATDGTLADYTGAGKIFAATATSGSFLGSVSGGELNVGLIANQAGSLYTYTDFGGAKSLLSMQLNFTLNGGGAATSAFQLYLGSFTSIASFDPGWNIYGSDRNWAKLNGSADSPYPIAANSPSGDPSTNLSVAQSYTFTLFLNQSGGSQAFDGPDGASHNLADNSWSFFVNNTLVADSVAKGTNGASTDLSGLVFNFARNYGGGSSNIDLDNIIIRDDLLVSSVPEPSALVLFALGGLAVFRRRR